MTRDGWDDSERPLQVETMIWSMCKFRAANDPLFNEGKTLPRTIDKYKINSMARIDFNWQERNGKSHPFIASINYIALSIAKRYRHDLSILVIVIKLPPVPASRSFVFVFFRLFSYSFIHLFIVSLFHLFNDSIIQ